MFINQFTRDICFIKIAAVVMFCVTVLFLLPLAGCVSIQSNTPRDMSDPAEVETYLRQYGYMESPGSRVAIQSVSRALLTFQQRWGLPATGEASLCWFINFRAVFLGFSPVP